MKDILKYVHLDLYGPSLVKSLARCEYFITFINEVYFLKLNDGVFGRFKCGGL